MALDRLVPMDRIPPQNLEMEQAVLGSMLIDRAAIEKAGQTLKPEDFYREAHRVIFECILSLVERDEPVDLLSTQEQLKLQGVLENVGGAAYLVQLMDSVPAAANAEYYAKVVEEKAILRRLIDASNQIQGLAHSEYEDIGEVVDRAERAVFGVAQRRMGSYFTAMRPLVSAVFEQIEFRSENKEATTGIATPFDDFNYMTAGLQPSDLVIIAARPSMGKCLTARSRIVHPETGERMTIEEYVRQRIPIVHGVSERGAVRATRVSDWVDSGVKPCYRVRTRTGREVEVTGHHPFLTVDGWTPLHDLALGDRIGVPRSLPAFGTDTSWSEARVRLLAYFIAEGGLTGKCPGFTNTDPALIADFRAAIAEEFPGLVIRQRGITYTAVRATRKEWIGSTSPVTSWLRDAGLMGKLAEQKRFPAAVWRWDRPRLATFLRTLMSCDGTIYPMSGYPRIEFAVASRELAEDVQHALTRFGIVAKRWRKGTRCWRVEITEPESVATYQREIGWIGEKATRFPAALFARRSNNGHAPARAWSLVRTAAARQGLSLTELARRSGEPVMANGGYNPHTHRGIPRGRLAGYAQVLEDPVLDQIAGPDIYWDEIVSIEPIGDHQVYDLTVPDGANFVAEDIFVHNTSLALGMGQYAALHTKLPVAVFSLEMSKEQLCLRMICSEARVDAHRLRTGYLQNEDWRKVGETCSVLSEAPLFIDDSPDCSALEMRAKCRRLMAEHGLGLILVDYLQLMRGHRKTDNRTQEIGEIARALKSLARELKVPVIALSQLSRAVEQRPDKRPMLSDLRESGSIEAEADVVLFIYRDAYYKMKEAMSAESEEADKEERAKRGEHKVEEAEIIIAKQRNGPTGKVMVAFHPHYARFDNLAKGFRDPDE